MQRLRELTDRVIQPPPVSYSLAVVRSVDLASRPPTLLIDEFDRPVRFAGSIVDYHPGQTVVWIDRSGAPLVVGPLPLVGESDEPDPWHEIGAAGEPAFTNSWGNLGGAHATAGFYRQSDGWVRLKGMLAGGTNTAAMFTLPAGYRPPIEADLTGISNGAFCTIRISTAGVVSKPEGGSNAHVSLAGITFPTAWNRAGWALPTIESAWDWADATPELFVRDDGWTWIRGDVTGPAGTRMLALPELSRVRRLDHMLVGVANGAFGYGRVDLTRKGTFNHFTGSTATALRLTGKNWFSGHSAATWTAPTLLNSWLALGSGFEPAGYYIDHFGVVHLQGVVTGSNTSPILQLPVGRRPLAQHAFVTVANALTVGRVDVNADGTVTRAVGSNGYLSLNGVQFRSEQ